MANHNISRARKKELEQIDPFQEKLLRGLAFTRQYKKQLFLILGAFVLVVVIFSAVLYSFSSAEKKASLLVSQASSAYDGAQDPESGYNLVQKDFTDIFDQYGNTAAGKMALIAFARICYDASEFDQAFDYFNRALKAFEKDPAMKNLLLSSIGHTLISQGKTDEAARYFEQVSSADSKVLKDEAYFSLGLIAQTDPDAASEGGRTAFETITTDFPDSMYDPVARHKLGITE